MAAKDFTLVPQGSLKTDNALCKNNCLQEKEERNKNTDKIVLHAIKILAQCSGVTR